MSPLSRISLVALPLLLGACTEGLRSPTGPLPEPADGPSLAVSAFAGQVVINEVMVDPNIVLDASGEWLELHNRTDAPIDVQGWRIAGANDAVHTITSSLVVPALGYVVVAKNGTVGTNGGVSVQYVYGAMNMANTSDWVALRDGSGNSVDSVAWSTAMPAGFTRGVTDPDGNNLDAKGSNWHTASATYGGGDRGTPGAQNDGRRSPLTVRVLDVGQGDAIYVTNGASRVLVDGGPSTTAMASVISEFGLTGKKVHLMVMTHPHADHLAGLREFFKTVRDVDVGIFLENKDVYAGSTLQSLRDSVNARLGRGELQYRDTDDPCGTGAAVCTFLLDGGARLRVMKPKPTDANPNNRSVAIKLVGPDSASFTMWMAGDAEHDAIEWFDDVAGYDTSPGMNVDVLKAGHHGSCNGITSRLLDLLTPTYVTMGVSSTNTYGHVHTQTKTLLTARGIPWYRTDENGRITITTPGTPGGGYSVTTVTGGASLAGDADGTSASSECVSL